MTKRAGRESARILLATSGGGSSRPAPDGRFTTVFRTGRCTFDGAVSRTTRDWRHGCVGIAPDRPGARSRP